MYFRGRPRYGGHDIAAPARVRALRRSGKLHGRADTAARFQSVEQVYMRYTSKSLWRGVREPESPATRCPTGPSQAAGTRGDATPPGRAPIGVLPASTGSLDGLFQAGRNASPAGTSVRASPDLSWASEEAAARGRSPGGDKRSAPRQPRAKAPSRHSGRLQPQPPLRAHASNDVDFECTPPSKPLNDGCKHLSPIKFLQRD
jgi:hypothetical protein